jgi:DNA-directed RNA polymerase specialized sigma24 family protein
MTFVGWILIASVLVWILAKRKKKKSVHVDASITPVDAFVVETVARAAAKRSSLSAEDLGKALAGDPDPEVVGRLEELVREVEVAFERLPDGAYEVRTRVHFEDTSVEAAARRFESDALPTAVSADLQRSGASRAFRRWDFPWAARGAGHWSD